jgi:protein SCO1/2
MYTDAASLRLLAKDYKIVYQKTAQKGSDDYLIDHSAGTYVYDPKGRLRLLMPYGSTPEAIAQDLRILLEAP